MKKPEILAPAGDMVCLQAALDSGADAVYIGLGDFNMRARSSANFNKNDLPEVSSRCKKYNAKLYLTLNSIIFERELSGVEEMLTFAKPYIDAVIVADWGVVTLCKKHNIPFHISTQMSCSNSISAQFMKDQGAERIVFARECSIDEIKDIIEKVDIETEAFVHGAQCVAMSGRCFLSHFAYGHSANRGECHQPCRRRFLIKPIDRFSDENGNPIHESTTEFEVTPHTVLSAKDLCSLPFVEELVHAGITSFKIEGRARNPEYVKNVVAAYREAVDAVLGNRYTQEMKDRLVEKAKEVFHRDFSTGLFYGRPGKDQFTDTEDSISKYVKKNVGVVLDYFTKAGVAQIKVQDQPLKIGDTIQIHGNKSGVVEFTISSMRRDEEDVTIAEKGTWVTVLSPRVRHGDRVYLMAERTASMRGSL
ncbi:MAG: U32 family peptidase [Kiritimatiellae bacterium]|nr:U32 family peptidase [Kiritimatiellia bacterium]